jgi:LCP family protein required for cell wall assembly
MPTSFKSSADTTSEFQNSLLQDEPTSENAFLEDSNDVASSLSSPKKTKSRFTYGKIFASFIFLISIILIGSFIFAYSMISNSNSFLASGDNKGDLFSQLGQIGSILNLNKRAQLKGESEGRTNYLLIGKDASSLGLTDTMMIASYFYKEKKLTTINIPRDMVYKDAVTGTSSKINSLAVEAQAAIDNGNQIAKSGEEYLGQFLGKDLGITIHYVASINFSGITEAVDNLGGIDVDVQNTFTDYRYPDFKNGYIRPAPYFEKGVTRMDGATALIYARSRHAGDLYNDNSIEAGDYARNRRQSVVVSAILERIKSQSLFDNVTKISTYLNIINKNFTSSLRLDEISALAQILKENPNVKENYITNVWSAGDNTGILCEFSTASVSQSSYCGGGYIGGGASAGNTKARAYLNNILNLSANDDQFFDTNVVVLGNQSFDTDRVYTDLANLGFTNVVKNNSFTKIKEATASSIESIKVYITDQKLKEKFEKIEKNPKIKYQVFNKIPEDLVVPASYKDSQILIWVS